MALECISNKNLSENSYDDLNKFINSNSLTHLCIPKVSYWNQQHGLFFL